jgi:hypothetical protein
MSMMLAQLFYHARSPASIVLPITVLLPSTIQVTYMWQPTDILSNRIVRFAGPAAVLGAVSCKQHNEEIQEPNNTKLCCGRNWL